MYMHMSQRFGSRYMFDASANLRLFADRSSFYFCNTVTQVTSFLDIKAADIQILIFFS